MKSFCLVISLVRFGVSNAKCHKCQNAKCQNAKKEKISKMLQFTCFIEGNFSKFGMCKMFDKYDVCPQFFYGKRNILLKSIAVITGYSLIVIKDM